jgi:hypothetical protein
MDFLNKPRELRGSLLLPSSARHSWSVMRGCTHGNAAYGEEVVRCLLDRGSMIGAGEDSDKGPHSEVEQGGHRIGEGTAARDGDMPTLMVYSYRVNDHMWTHSTGASESGTWRWRRRGTAAAWRADKRGFHWGKEALRGFTDIKNGRGRIGLGLLWEEICHPIHRT